MVCQLNGLEIFDYTPLQVKMGVASYGRATKKQIQEMVKLILNLDEIPKPDDAADAIAIAINHINNRNIPTNNVGKIRKNTIKMGTKISIEEYKKLINK